VNYPALWSIDSWVNNFSKLLDSLDIVQVHLFGASLGGFLAQKFAEATHTAQRVQSLILCNSFTDPAFFNSILHPVCVRVGGFYFFLSFFSLLATAASAAADVRATDSRTCRCLCCSAC
jgi:pimeloyl-ACP methyl ester carboxylesterase